MDSKTLTGIYAFLIPILLLMIKQEIFNTLASWKVFHFRKYDDGDPNTMELLQISNPATGVPGNVLVDRYAIHIPMIGIVLRLLFPRHIGSARECGVFFYHLRDREDGSIEKVGRNVPLLKWSQMMRDLSNFIPKSEEMRIKKVFKDGKVYGNDIEYSVLRSLIDRQK